MKYIINLTNLFYKLASKFDELSENSHKFHFSTNFILVGTNLRSPSRVPTVRVTNMKIPICLTQILIFQA